MRRPTKQKVSKTVISINKPGMVVHAYNSIYKRSIDNEDCSLKPDQGEKVRLKNN
jgi:hypothetical protein